MTPDREEVSRRRARVLHARGNPCPLCGGAAMSAKIAGLVRACIGVLALAAAIWLLGMVVVLAFHGLTR